MDPSQGRGGRVAPQQIGESVVWTHTQTHEWQHEAWQYEEDVTELRQSLNWQASAASRAHLFACEKTPDGTPGDPTEDPRVRAATELLLDRSKQPGWLYTAVYNAALVGDLYVYGAEFDGRDEYRIASTEDVQRAGNKKITVRVDDRRPRPYDPASELLIRIWWPYPRHPWQPGSSVRSALPVLCDIWKLTRLISSVADSRMRGAGLLLLSNKLDVPGADPSEPKPSVAQLLLSVASKALADPDSASAHVPTILEGDLDAAEKVAELINLGVDFPKLLQSLLDGAIRRFALGQPIPSGIILGENANHWNEFHREDEAIKLAIGPLLHLIASGLAESWLPAAFKAAGLDPTGWTLGVDMTAVEQRPDNSQVALEVHDRGALSDDALRREAGFSDDDAPSPGEQSETDSRAPRSGRSVAPVGPPEGDGGGGEPEPLAASWTPRAAHLNAVARIAAVAALVRMGNRIRGRTHTSRRQYADIPAHLIHTHATAAEREAVSVDDWPDGVLDTFAEAAAEAGYDHECACYRLRARVGQTFRNGTALDRLSLDMDECRDG
ncbi:MAG: hypothetical protein ACRDQD_01165 [Nocardioidaceae bacterium]